VIYVNFVIITENDVTDRMVIFVLGWNFVSGHLFVHCILKQDATLSLRWPRDASIIWLHWKLCVSTKAVDDCARISTLQSYHYSAVKLFSKYSNKC